MHRTVPFIDDQSDAVMISNFIILSSNHLGFGVPVDLIVLSSWDGSKCHGSEQFVQWEIRLILSLSVSMHIPNMF